MIQSQTQIPKNLPFEACLPVSNMLSFKMSHFGSEDGPYAEILSVLRSMLEEEVQNT